MKKRCFVWLALLVLLIAALALPAYAATVPTDVTWIELSSEEDFLEWFGGATKGKNLTEGYTAGMTRYYKMTDDITIDQNSTVYYLSYGSYAVNVYFDLNGHTLTYTSDVEAATRMFGSYVANTTHTFVGGTIVNNSKMNAYGPIFMMNKGSLVMEDVEIIDNATDMSFTYGGKIISAVGAGNDITLTNVDITTGSAAANNYGLAIRSETANLTMTGCNFTSVATKRTSYGGLIYKVGGNLNITDCTFTDGFGKYGGNVYSKGAAVTITGSTFTNGRSEAGGQGGDLAIYDGAATITDCTFTNNGATTPDFGGSIFLQTTSTVSLKNCDITGGKAKYAGAFYSVNAALTMEDCTVTGGQATVDGGNMQLKNGSATLVSTNITGGKATANGGNISAANSVKLYFKSGTVSGGSAKNGGNIATSIGGGTGPTLYFQGMTVTGGTATGNGGNLYIVANAGYAGKPTVNFSAGIITDGTATGNGGNVYLGGLAKEAAVTDAEGNVTKAAIAQRNVTFTMTGGTIGGAAPEGKEYAGTADNGGNMYATYATVNLSGTSDICYGYASTGGGNIMVTNATVNLSENAVVSNGYADNGGNIYPSTAGVANIKGGTVTKGFAKSTGGNFYMSSTNTKLNISGGLISDGFTYGSGGNVYMNNGKINMTGGVVSGGEAFGGGGNFYLHMGYGTNAAYCSTATFADDGDASTPIPRIIDGIATGADGGNIHMSAYGNKTEGATNTMILGNCEISGGSAYASGDDLYVTAVAILQVLPEFDQTVTVHFEDAALPTPVYGGVLDTARFSCSGVYTGKLLLEGDYGEPWIYGTTADTYLHIAGAAVAGADGSKVWYENNVAAVAAYTAEASYLQAGPGELSLNGGDYVVDIAGQTVAITGTGNVTCFDSANDTYKTFGTATVSGPTLVNGTMLRLGGKNYYTLNDNGTYSFHRIAMQLVSMSLRPSEAGMYYTGKWSCDDVLAAHIDGFGVVVSLKDIPNDDFANNENTLWTTIAGSEFASGVTKAGAMVTGILKDAADGATPERIAMNSQYARMAIFAKAYATIDGTTYTGLGADCSLYDILKTVSDSIEQYSGKAETMQAFMTRWISNGLMGEPWDSLNFQVSEDIVHLNRLYAGTTPYYGDLHEHSDSDGTSDGHQPLSVWKEGMEKLNMDFAAILDHKQSLHMYLEDWDPTVFIGGSEAATTITDRTGVKLHYNMVFADPAGLEAVVSSFPEFNWQYYPEDYTGTNAEKLAGGWHFSYPGFTAERFGEVIDAIYANGGFMAIAHPKSADMVTTDKAEDAWFRDGTGVEVFYTYRSTRDGWKTLANYGLWTDMLAAGKKVYATAGNDEHELPSDKAVSAIYATERHAQAWVDQLRAGNFTAGGVGVRSAIGDTMMGGSTSFAGQKLRFSVGDFHQSLYYPDHTYRVDVVTDQGVVYSQEISCTETFYYAMDVDADAAFYYFEIFDVTLNSRIAIGNPIWNEK